MIIKTFKYFTIFFTILFLVAVPGKSNAKEKSDRPVQIVRVLSEKATVRKNEDFQINVQYNVSDSTKTIGIGLQIHYDSSCFELINFECYDIKIISNPLLKDDEENDDNDDRTDKLFIAAWLDLSKSWPLNKDVPFNLMTLNFRVKLQALRSKSFINVIETSHDHTYDCQLENYELSILDTLLGDINIDGLINLKDIVETINFLSD